jgi:hypothetical protein
MSNRQSNQLKDFGAYIKGHYKALYHLIIHIQQSNVSVNRSLIGSDLYDNRSFAIWLEELKIFSTTSKTEGTRLRDHEAARREDEDRRLKGIWRNLKTDRFQVWRPNLELRAHDTEGLRNRTASLQDLNIDS